MKQSNRFGKSSIFFAAIMAVFFGQLGAVAIKAEYGDLELKFFGLFRPEAIYGRNINLLNNSNDLDKIFYFRHIIDFNTDLLYGRKTYDAEVAHFFFSIRNKSVWGNPGSVAATTEAEQRLVNSTLKKHKHQIPRHIFWMREGWLDISLTHALGLGFENKHSFMLGAFPFNLGRGIALGDAFAVAPELLGFYTETIVDQYAFGGKFYGDIVRDALTYDFYAAILQNKSSSFGETAEEIYNNALGRIFCPERGFGHINFLVAGRFNWTVFESEKYGALSLEPYALFNHDPEQKVEFPADSYSKLGTVGLAAEYEGPRFCLGFDWAQNFGRQNVLGWDRNQIAYTNIGGYIAEINNNVFQGSPTGGKVLYVKGSDAQRVIDASRESESLGVRQEGQNGKFIGSAIIDGKSVDLYNSLRRFRDPYINTYKGYMFVTDASVWLYKKDLQLAVTAGVASGDENPNEVTKDSDYKGFLPLQEMYSGKRVKSSFLLGGAGRAKRPLSTPTDIQAPSIFSANISGFTNIVLCGSGLQWKPQDAVKKYKVNPNVLAYWLEQPTRKFDLVAKKDSKDLARTYLGTELNIFFDYFVFRDMRVYLVASAFFPGTFYTDIRGKPLDADQAAELEDLDISGIDVNEVPNLGTDIAYTFNGGIEFKF